MEEIESFAPQRGAHHVPEQSASGGGADRSLTTVHA